MVGKKCARNIGVSQFFGSFPGVFPTKFNSSESRRVTGKYNRMRLIYDTDKNGRGNNQVRRIIKTEVIKNDDNEQISNNTASLRYITTINKSSWQEGIQQVIVWLSHGGFINKQLKLTTYLLRSSHFRARVAT